MLDSATLKSAKLGHDLRRREETRLRLAQVGIDLLIVQRSLPSSVSDDG